MDLPIPLIIDNYNFNMNGVNRADQLRASIECHRKGNRNWLPLLWWLLDSVKVNAYLLYKYQYKEKEGDFHPDLFKKMLTHRQFQEELALRLILDGYEQMKGHRRILEGMLSIVSSPQRTGTQSYDMSLVLRVYGYPLNGSRLS